MKFTKHALMGSSSLTRPLLLLGTASALMGAGPAYALGANALPQGGTITGGSATISSSGNTLNVNQSSNRVIVDWQSFNVGSAATTNFAQPNSSSIAVNRVNASTNPSQIEGTINANGQVWILNPNGVFFGKTATVNAAGIVASTANINDTEFMSGSSTLHMTGGDSGKVVNEGNVTVGQGGLAAFVAPSVRNSGTINATVGKVSLAAGDSYTLDLAGDHLVEIATGATNAVVTQSGKIVNPGGTIEISAVAASAVVDSVINMSGVTTASSATSSGGQIVLGADDINVASTAQTSADGGGTGNGGNITMVANKTGSYAGSYSSQGGAQGGDGGNVETSGAVINLDPGISVNTSAANGKTGNWTLDPDTLDVVAGSGGDLSSGGNDDSTSTVGADTVVAQLATTNVNLSARNSITVASAIDSSAQTNYNTLSLNQESGATGILTVNLNAPITLGANQTLNGQASTINVAAGALIQNGIDVAGSTNTSSPALINVAAGTYDEALDILKNVDIEGAAGGLIIIQPTSSSQLVNTLTGHKYTSDMQVTVFVNGASNVTLNNLTIDGNDLGNDAVVFWNNSSGTISNSTIEDVKPFTGEQTGQGLAVDATIDNTDTLTVSNVAFSNWDKNAIDAETGDGTNHNGGNITLDVEGSSFTGAGATNVIAQNGIVLWEQGGGTINATINNSTFSDIDYTGGDATAAGVLQYGSLNGTVTVSNSTFNDTVQEYISTAGGVAHELDATNNNTFNGVTVSASTPLDELYTIENRIIDGVTSGNGADLPNTDSLVRLVTGNVYVTAADEAFGTAIQYAVNLATAGDTVNVQAGTYQEQVSINKSLTLDGAGSGVGGTIIEAPATIDPTFTTQVGFAPGTNVDAVVGVASTVPGTPIAGPVTIENLQVNGESNGNGNDYFMGIGAQDVDITVTGVDVTGARDNPLDGSQHGVGIGVFNDDGLTRTASITDSTVEDYQKNGIVAQGGNLAVTITGNTVTGDGNINTIAQNGIELFGLTGEGDGTITGTVSGNIVTGVSYDDPSDYATSIYLLDTDNVTVSGNTITGEGAAAGSSYGVSILGSDNVTISGNSITDTEIGVSIDDALYAPYFNASGAVGISNNLINSNGTGVAIAVNNAGLVSNTNTYAGTVTAFNNDLSGNTVAVDLESSNATANFSGNWWGTTSDSAIEASIAGSASSVDISPFLDSGNSVALGTPGFNGDFSSITVTDTGAQTGATGRINEGLADATTGGTVNVEDGSYGEAILVSSPVILDFGNAVSATSLTVNSGLTGVQLSGDLAANSVTLNSAIALSGNLTLDTSAADGNITTAAVDGSTAGGQSLTLNTGTGTASVGNIGPIGPLHHQRGVALGAVIDNNTTTLTGVSYTAASFELGATTLAVSTDATTMTATGGGITLASVDGNSGTDAQILTLTATGTVSLGNVGGNTSYLVGDVNDNSVSATAATTLTGVSYTAASFELGATTLASSTDATTMTATGGGITLASVDGNSGTDAQILTLTATGTVSLGNVGGNTSYLVGDVNDNSVSATAATVLTGSSYNAASFSVGDTTLSGDTSITSSDSTGITLGTVNGSGDNLTLTANNSGPVSLNNVGGLAALGDVTDNGAATTLTGSSYNAGSFELGATTLANTSRTPTTTMTATGGITLDSVNGNSRYNAQALNLTASSVSLGDVGDNTSDRVGDVNDNGANTTLTGSNYSASSFELGATTLDDNTTITANGYTGGGITLASVDGSGTGSQSLTLNDTRGTVSLGDVGDNTLATVTDVNDNGATTTLTGTGYNAASFELGDTTLTNSSHLTTLTANSITLDSVDGNSTQTANAQALTLNANTVSLGSVGSSSDLVGAVIDDQANPTTLTGTVYKAISFLFGNLALGNTSTATVTATTGNITAGTVEGTGHGGQNLTLVATNGTVSLNNVGDTTAVGTFTDTSNKGTTLAGSIYKGGSLSFGNLILENALTTITASSGGITTGTVDGSGTAQGQSLALNATHGTVSLGDVGDKTPATVGDVNDNGATTTLTGSKYTAGSFELGATTLTTGTHLTTITATSNATYGITLASVSGNSTQTANAQALTLNANAVSLGNVGNNSDLVGAVIDDQANNLTALTGTNYKASSFLFGNLVLDNTTTIDATNGGITAGTVDGAGDALTLTASGTVSLGDIGDAGALGAVTDNNTTTLKGSGYDAASFSFGNLTLDANTTITSTTGNITTGTVDGSTLTGQSLTLKAHGTASLGDVGDNTGATVTDVNDNSQSSTAATTLTGSKYKAGSFELGATTLTTGTHLTTITATSNATYGITLASVSGNSTNSAQALTLNANAVSLGNVGNNSDLVGAVIDDQANNLTALTGTNYKASSFLFGNLVLDNTTTIDATNGGITAGTVDGAGDALTLTASGTVSLGDIGDAGALGAVTDNNTTTLKGSGYDAASFDLGDTTLQSSSHLTTITANSVILDSVSGNSTQTSNAQSLTLNAGAVSLGDVGNNSDLVGAVIDDQASNLTTLTGAIYKAISFLFGNVALGSSGTTSITATTGNITTGTVEGTRSGENLTLSASNGNVSLANVGDTGSALGTITDTSNHGTTLTGSIYKGSSLAFGNLILDNNTTITASSGGITTGTVDGDGTGSQSLALNASHGTVSLGDVGDNAGATVSDVNDNGATTTLSGSKYKAGSFELGATTLQSGTNLTTITATGGADSITLASVSGDSMHTPEALTLNANAVSLGNVGNNSNEVGAVIDDQANNLTALTGTTYNASSFLFGNLTLASNTSITASTGSITTGSVEGTNSGGQNLTLNASHGNVSLNNAGDTTALGALTDTNNNGTTLTGSIYKGSSLAFGNLILDNNTTMTASNGGITTGTVDGSGTGSQSLNLTATGTVSLGDVGDNAGATVSDVNDNGATTTLSGSKYKAGSFELGATTLQSGTNLTTITATGGADSITLASVSGDSMHTPEALTLNANAVSLGNVGNNSNEVGAVIDDQANNLTALTGTTYNASSFLFGNLTLASNTSITASTGSITTGSVEGTNSGGQNLTLAAADGTVSLGNMGGLGTVIDTSNESTTLTGSSYNAASFDFGAVLLGANVTIATFNATGDITMTSLDGNTAGNQSLDIDGAGSVHLGNVGFTTALNDLDDDAGATTTTTLTGNTYNALTEEFDSNVLLTAGTTTITGTNGLMIVEVNGTTAGANNLTLVGPTTGLTYLGDTGSNVALGAVSAANPTVLYGDTYDANSFTFGQVEIAALPGASGTVNVNTSADNGQITMASVDELTGNPFALPAALVLNAGTGNVSLGNVGATASLTSLTDTSNTTLTGGTYNAGSLTFGALTLDANTSLNTSARNGAITVASVNGSTAGGQSLTITAGTGNVSLGNTGASTQLGAVSDTSNTTLTGGTYNANSLNFGALTLDANTTLNTSADNGALTVASVNGSTVGGQSLTLNSGTGTISLGNTGASTRLGALSDSGTTTLMGSTYNANSFTFGGNVTLTAATTTLNSTQSASAAGDITFNANILGTSNGGQSLVLIAGPGTGAASANGNLTWQNAGATTLELDNLTVSGNNLSALTAELTGNFTSTLTGNQAFADNTLNAGGNVLSNVGGNATGHIVAVGNVTLNAGGNITGTINGYNIDITAASLTNSDLTAVNDITVVAGLLLNDIFNAGQTVSIIANSVNGTTVTANTFDVSALTGSVNGTWNFLNATTGLNLRVNGELASFETFNGQQLVVEGFTLPIGTQIGANGALILPQGVLIGLLAPGGGQPVFVLVHSVQDLGALLSEGYVAIVIDLDGRKKDDDGMQVASN